MHIVFKLTRLLLLLELGKIYRALEPLIGSRYESFDEACLFSNIDVGKLKLAYKDFVS